MVIYKITNRLNNKVYIGQTIRDLATRVQEHRRKANSLVGKAINKYGIENFTIEEIYTATSIEDLNDNEVYYISQYNCLAPNGYNLCLGGGNTKGYSHPQETKDLLSSIKKETYLGTNNPFYGKKHTTESKQKISNSRKGKKLPQAWVDNLNRSKYKPVIELTTRLEFPSIKDASEYFNIESTHITRVCKGKRKSTNGLIFAYVHDNIVPSL